MYLHRKILRNLIHWPGLLEDVKWWPWIYIDLCKFMMMTDLSGIVGSLEYKDRTMSTVLFDCLTMNLYGLYSLTKYLHRMSMLCRFIWGLTNWGASIAPWMNPFLLLFTGRWCPLLLVVLLHCISNLLYLL